jgi:hypothetical protein
MVGHFGHRRAWTGQLGITKKTVTAFISCRYDKPAWDDLRRKIDFFWIYWTIYVAFHVTSTRLLMFCKVGDFYDCLTRYLNRGTKLKITNPSVTAVPKQSLYSRFRCKAVQTQVFSPQRRWPSWSLPFPWNPSEMSYLRSRPPLVLCRK